MNEISKQLQVGYLDYLAKVHHDAVRHLQSYNMLIHLQSGYAVQSHHCGEL